MTIHSINYQMCNISYMIKMHWFVIDLMQNADVNKGSLRLSTGLGITWLGLGGNKICLILS